MLVRKDDTESDAESDVAHGLEEDLEELASTTDAGSSSTSPATSANSSVSTAASMADGKIARVINQLEKLKVSWNSGAKGASDCIVDISDEECEKANADKQEAAFEMLQKAMVKSRPNSDEIQNVNQLRKPRQAVPSGPPEPAEPAEAAEAAEAAEGDGVDREAKPPPAAPTVWRYFEVRKAFLSKVKGEGASHSNAMELWDDSEEKRLYLKDVPLPELKRRKFVPKYATLNPWADEPDE